MKRAVVVGLAAAVIIGLGFWLWTTLFPTPEKVIRSRLNALAKTLSFDAHTGTLSKAYSAQKAADFFTTNVDVELNLAGYDTLSLHGRDEVLQIAVASRSRLTALKVEFPDMNITVDPDGLTAKVNLTAKATMPEERDISAQEFDFRLKKVDGVWLIDHVETVKTLSRAATIQLVLGSARVSRAVCGVSPKTSSDKLFLRNRAKKIVERNRRRDAVDGTRDACAPQLLPVEHDARSC